MIALQNSLSKPLTHKRQNILKFLLVGLFGFFFLSEMAIAQSGGKGSLLIQGTTMGPIPYRVTIATPSEGLTEERASAVIADALEKINKLMSTYKPYSDVSRFNRHGTREWFEVDPETARVVARALELSEISEGAFDITVGPAVNRWRFGPEKSDEEFQIPTADEIKKLKQLVGYHALEVKETPPAVRKTNPELEIDLSAIAKGYAVDVVANALVELGCSNFLVEVGGETYVRGEREGGGRWRVGIEAPNELQINQANEILELSNEAVATSGDYRNYRAVGGKRYSHTIDPRTCAPVENRLASATVIAKDCMTADGVATAVMVLGAQKGIALCERMGLEGFVKVRDEEFGDHFTTFATDNFPVSTRLVKPEQSSESSAATGSIWPVFLAALIVFTLAVLGMASGAIFGNNAIKGSCGGVASATGATSDPVCGVCSNPVEQCPDENQQK